MRLSPPWSPACSAVIAAAVVSLLASCHSTHKKDTAEGASSGDLGKRLLKVDQTKTSEFEKKFDTASLGDRGLMKAMGKRSYSASDYKGNTTYKGSKDYQTKLFAQADKTSREQSHVSSMASKKERSSDKTFQTGDSRFSNKKAPGDHMAFNRSKQEFKTSDFGPGKKSLQDNKRPYFQPAGELDQGKTAYSEQDVKALLNRN